MAFDINRINAIEHNLRENIDSLSNNDLIYYLEYNTHNTNISSTDLSKTEAYFKKINSSFYFEDIFVNTSNYSASLPFIIGLLLPFYYMYPKFYKLGSIGTIIGLVSYLAIFRKIGTLYSNFFNNIGIYFFIATLIFYIIFFILLNKLNHISLFFISGLVVYFFINYVCKIILTIPLENNPYNKYRATIKEGGSGKDNKNYTPYNLLIESTCLELIKRYNLTLPSGNMLYSYLTDFVIGDNNDKYSDFYVSLLGPLFSVGILWLLSYFLNKVKGVVAGSNEEISYFPIVGMSEQSFKYYTCGANYILPKHLNCDLLIHDVLDKYKNKIFGPDKSGPKYEFDVEMYKRLEKGLLRISNELLEKYNPKFTKIELTNDSIFNHINENKSFIKIRNIFRKYDVKLPTLTAKYSDEIKKKIETNFDIPFYEKEVIYSALEQINNCLSVYDLENESYKNLSELAIEDLLYDDKLKVPTLELFKKIANEFRKNFFDNIKAKILYGYDDNIITYNYLKDWTIPSNMIFSIILKLISTWLLFAKPIGSSWLLSKYFLIPRFGFKDIIKNISETKSYTSFFWKYISLGLDSEYFKDIYKKINTGESMSFASRIGDIILSVIIFIILFVLLQYYNSCSFAYSLSPSWYNLIFQIVFFINIIGNIVVYEKKKSNIWYNIIFFGIVLFLAIIITILVLFIKK